MLAFTSRYADSLWEKVSREDGNNYWDYANKKLYCLVQVTGDAIYCPQGINFHKLHGRNFRTDLVYKQESTMHKSYFTG